MSRIPKPVTIRYRPIEELILLAIINAASVAYIIERFSALNHSEWCK